MGFAPQELDRSRYDRSLRVAEVPAVSNLPHEIMSSETGREPVISKPRKEVIGDKPVVYELPGRQLMNLRGKARVVSYS